MKIYSTYSVKIKHYNSIFKNTISVYRHAVDYLITVCLNEWKILSLIDGSLLRQQFVERLCHSTKDNPSPRYPDFDMKFYKMPSYWRVLVKQLNQKFNYFTASVRRGWLNKS